MIEFSNASYSYTSASGTVQALCGVNAQLRRGEITAVIGHTGSGKSTFMELAAGLAEPDSGNVTLDGCDIASQRKKIGVVFQYPEYQLFADTVRDDIAFGPMNYGIRGSEMNERIRYAAKITGLDDSLLNRSPFELSGGQKRMAAAAGALAMKPEILLLDEPAAGLDPSGREQIFSIMRQLLDNNGNMIIAFVTHSMEDAANYADQLILLDHGCITAHGTPGEVFAQKELLYSCGLDIPAPLKIADGLRRLGDDIGGAITDDEIFLSVKNMLRSI